MYVLLAWSADRVQKHSWPSGTGYLPSYISQCTTFQGLRLRIATIPGRNRVWLQATRPREPTPVAGLCSHKSRRTTCPGLSTTLVILRSPIRNI